MGPAAACPHGRVLHLVCQEQHSKPVCTKPGSSRCLRACRWEARPFLPCRAVSVVGNAVCCSSSQTSCSTQLQQSTHTDSWACSFTITSTQTLHACFMSGSYLLGTFTLSCNATHLSIHCLQITRLWQRMSQRLARQRMPLLSRCHLPPQPHLWTRDPRLLSFQVGRKRLQRCVLAL